MPGHGNPPGAGGRPHDLKATEEVVTEELAAPEPSVIITRRPCVLLKSVEKHPPLPGGAGQVQGLQDVHADRMSRHLLEGQESGHRPHPMCGLRVCEQLCKFDAFRHC